MHIELAPLVLSGLQDVPKYYLGVRGTRRGNPAMKYRRPIVRGSCRNSTKLPSGCVLDLHCMGIPTKLGERKPFGEKW
jgi:hypothetical protein